ncbi:MAG: C4-dicarboxylate TRAP transporter substrate-binding protein [Proteobacteria bacterium]|nr:C4-dicarboxylate TRAP transporter substrate-binding protein [Pseudomonadota bacterium]
MKTLQRFISTTVIAAIMLAASASITVAKTHKITIVAGHPPIFLWVTLTRDFFIPEVDKRLQAAGGKDRIIWNQAYGGTIAKIGGVLEAIESGVADMGFVGTLFEAPKMPLHNVTYMTPFGGNDIFKVVDTVSELQAKIPAIRSEWDKNNQVFLGGAGLDSYGILTNFPAKTVDDLKGHKIAAPGPSANWIKGTGAVAVAGNLTTYYNSIKTGVYDGTLTFMTAASALKLHEVAPNILIVNFGAQFAGGLTINKDIFESFSPETQKIFREVGKEWEVKLAKAQTDRLNNSLSLMKKNGATITYLSQSERRRWAEMLPNVPMDWAKAMEKKRLPGAETVKAYLDGLRARGVELPRNWDQ